jgi:hypothetical protein
MSRSSPEPPGDARGNPPHLDVPAVDGKRAVVAGRSQAVARVRDATASGCYFVGTRRFSSSNQLITTRTSPESGDDVLSAKARDRLMNRPSARKS